MMLAPLLALLLAGTPALVTDDAAPAADAPTAIWRTSAIVTAAGALRVLPGWHVRVGPGDRASLAGPAPRTPRPSGSWDDDVTVGGVHVAVRVASRTARAVYVEGRLYRGAQARAFVLHQDLATGAWSDAVSPL